MYDDQRYQGSSTYHEIYTNISFLAFASLAGGACNCSYKGTIFLDEKLDEDMFPINDDRMLFEIVHF